MAETVYVTVVQEQVLVQATSDQAQVVVGTAATDVVEVTAAAGTVVEIASPVTETVEIVAQGPQGPAGPAGPPGPQGPAGGADGALAAAAYVHQQLSPDTVWLITHGLGFYPNVVLLDSAGEGMEADVTYLNSVQIRVDLSAPVSGTAYLS